VPVVGVVSVTDLSPWIAARYNARPTRSRYSGHEGNSHLEGLPWTKQSAPRGWLLSPKTSPAIRAWWHELAKWTCDNPVALSRLSRSRLNSPDRKPQRGYGWCVLWPQPGRSCRPVSPCSREAEDELSAWPARLSEQRWSKSMWSGSPPLLPHMISSFFSKVVVVWPLAWVVQVIWQTVNVWPSATTAEAGMTTILFIWRAVRIPTTLHATADES